MASHFFTNQEGDELQQKFEGILNNYVNLDAFHAVVGYFRASGYHAIREHLLKLGDVKILVGINVDDYTSKEGVKLNNLVYQEFSLSNEDIREVENWYARRYPRLVEAQKENLAEQGKPTDYLELYEMVEEGEEIRGEV